MVYFQVEDIVRKFEALSELESNGWKQATKRPKTRKGKVRKSRLFLAPLVLCT